MKIFDLHNDALTCGAAATENNTIYAVWTSKLSLSQTQKIVEDNKGKMLAIEDCGVFLSDIEQIASHNYMYVGLTWNSFNGLAGGVYSDGSLTDKGKHAINVLNNSGITIDTAHLNKESFYEVTERANKIICSHTCFNEVNNHPRNLTRDQISAIINKGGIVGLCFVCDFLGGNTVEAVVRHIDWFLNRFGDDNLSVGTDFYGSTDLPLDLSSYEKFNKLVLAMIRLGYSDSTIQNILYNNAAEYFFGH